ncbi:MAG: PEP-CTERM sorting domain-containing protein [Planctomycetota bacterium]|jgi:hypothetical protein
MRKLLGIALGALLVLGVAGTAGAGTLTYTGTMTFGLATLPSGVGTSSGTIVVNGSLGGAHLNTLTLDGVEFGPITTSLPVSASATVNSVRLTGLFNLGATMTGISGGAPLGQGKMGMSGLAKICLVLGPCPGANVPVPLTPTGTPLKGLGIGGTQLFTGSVAHTTYTATTFIPAAVALTMIHAPWTLGTPAMTIHTAASSITSPVLPSGFAHGPLTEASSTAVGSGVIQLVTATKVFTSLTGAFPELPVFIILNMHFVPEPGTLLLVCAGVAGLAVIGRKRSRK